MCQITTVHCDQCKRVVYVTKYVEGIRPRVLCETCDRQAIEDADRFERVLGSVGILLFAGYLAAVIWLFAR